MVFYTSEMDRVWKMLLYTNEMDRVLEYALLH